MGPELLRATDGIQQRALANPRGIVLGRRQRGLDCPLRQRGKLDFFTVRTAMPAPAQSDPAPSAFAHRGSEPLFHVRELARVYGEGSAAVTALAWINLDLFAGELIVLLGASGSGKSTLLNQLGGLDSPTHGTLLYRGANLAEFDEAALTNFRRDAVGFVFQAYNLIPSLTARENVALITEICRDPMAPEEALALVGLADRMDHFPAQLSGGEQQRVAIARAVAKRPEVLLCDEPTGALDVRTGITVLEAIERINRELGTLAVIITHNAILADMADRVFTLSDGRIVNVRENQVRGQVRSLAW